MKVTPKRLNQMLVISAALLWRAAAPGQVIGQWDFNSSNLVQSAGSTVGDLQYADGSGGATETGTAFGSTTALGIPDINGTAATVMRFLAATNGQGYLVPALLTGNGGGSLVNSWTLILDVLYPTASDNTDRPIIDTDGSQTSGGGFVAGPDFIVSASDGIGAPTGPYSGSIQPNKWYRIAMTATTNLVSFYINGVRVGTANGAGVDGRFSLSTTQPYLILSTILDQAAIGYVNSIQIRDVALNPGQIQALGGPSAAGIPQAIPPVPAFIDSSTPAAGAAGVGPQPNISVLLNQGDTTVDSSSIKLLFDGALLPSSVAATPPTFLVTSAITNFLDPNSTHSLSLIWSDSVAGTTTNTWSFTVVGYQNVTLPTPFYIETFDGLSENVSGPTPLPAGWSVTNQTWAQTAGFNLDDLLSDSYADWVLITAARELSWAGAPVGEPGDRTDLPPIVLNGQLLSVSNFISGNLMWAETDQRCGGCWGQYQEMHTADIDCTGKTNVFVAFNSFYEQNQDNMNLVEYSIDQGQTWLPVRYFFCTLGNGEQSDIIYTNDAAGKPVIDIGQTFSRVDNNRSWAPWPAGCTDTAVCPPHGTNYGYYVNAPITTDLIPFIGGYTNDDTMSSKEIVVVRLAKADGQSKVRFRFVDTGTSAWFWGIDNFGLYEINTPVIGNDFQPLSQTIDAGTPVTFNVTAVSIKPLTYQWQFNGVNIASATNSSYTIASVAPGDAGAYKVLVKNADGTTASAPATLTVNTTPQIVTQPYGQVAYLNSSVTFSTTVTGGRPMSLQWYRDGSAVAGGTSQTLTLNGLQAGDAGNYTLVLSNSFGTNISVAAALTVFSGPITNSLVVHLKFDGDYKDVSGSGLDGAAVGTPTFQPGILGQAVHLSSSGTPANNPDTNNYVTLGTQLKLSTNDFSVSLWGKIAFQNDDKPFIANKDWGSGSNPGWVISTEGSGMKWNIRDDQSARRDSQTVAPQLENGSWHNVVVTFIRSSVGSIYVDGQLVNITSVAPDANKAIGTLDTALPVNIGQDGTGHYTDGGGAAALDMLMDDLGIWQRALTPSEAAAIYAAGQAGKDLSQAVVAATPTQPTLSVTVSGGTLHLTWTASPTGRLQTTTTLAPASWADVPGTTGLGTATVPISGASAFFRVAQ
jgi:hypothetical protein